MERKALTQEYLILTTNDKGNVNLHAEHKTVKRREKKGRNVERLDLSGFRA